MALFGEKYGDTVRVVGMGDFSKELCGGTHVSHTGQIQNFKIVSESGVAAGVRRIEAITAANVNEYYKKLENELNEAAAIVKSTPSNLLERLGNMMNQLKELSSEIESLKAKAAKDGTVQTLNGRTHTIQLKNMTAKIDGKMTIDLDKKK